jgi:hypothetical protein
VRLLEGPGPGGRRDRVRLSPPARRQEDIETEKGHCRRGRDARAAGHGTRARADPGRSCRDICARQVAARGARAVDHPLPGQMGQDAGRDNSVCALSVLPEVLHEGERRRDGSRRGHRDHQCRLGHDGELPAPLPHLASSSRRAAPHHNVHAVAAAQRYKRRKDAVKEKLARLEEEEQLRRVEQKKMFSENFSQAEATALAGAFGNQIKSIRKREAEAQKPDGASIKWGWPEWGNRRQMKD